MKTKPHARPELFVYAQGKLHRRASKNIFQSVLFITVFFFYSSCSNNKQENQNPPRGSSATLRAGYTEGTKIVKQDTVSPPRITVLTTLADTYKPKESFLEKTPKPQPINIPPIITPLAVLKNKKGEVVKGNDSSTFILGEAGGVSNFSNYTTDQGLALDAISCSIMDKMGNLWFGTQGGGVSRYDGKSFTNYTTAQGLANNIVLSILEDKTGNLWFGTYGGGVSRYNGKSFTNFTATQGLATNTVWSICEDKTGNLWFGTDGGGVSRYNPSAKLRPDSTSFTNYSIEQGLPNKVVLSICEDKTGTLWFGTYGGGVSRYNGKSFTNFTTSQGLANNIVWSITEDKRGNIWFGTNGGGLSRYNPSGKLGTDPVSFTNYSIVQGLANNIIKCITEDTKGNLWFGTSGGGLSLFNPSDTLRAGKESFTSFTTGQGLANNGVRSITEDKTGNLWFGTDGGGVSRYDGKSFGNFTTDQGLASNIVNSICEDKRGNIWFGTYEGVSQYNGKSFTNYTKLPGLAKNMVLSICEDKTGNLWFGTYEGVSRYTPSADLSSVSFTNFTTTQGLANNQVGSIYEDKTGNIWFGTYSGGLSRYDGNRVEAIEAALKKGEIVPQQIQQDLKKINGKFIKSFTNYSTAHGLAHKNIKSIIEDKTGNLWFGTYGGGVSRYDGKSFTNFTTSQGLANNIVWSICEDTMGNLWFGTNGGGISRYDGNSFTNFTTVQGLPDNNVTQVVEAPLNPPEGGKQIHYALFIGTNLGVAVLTGWKDKDGKVLPFGEVGGANEELKNYTPVIEIYNSAKGYPVKDVNPGQNGMFADSKGIIWIATGADKTALVRFDYAALNKNNMPPDVLIQSVKINNENICWYSLEGSKLEQTDSTTTPPNITEEVTTFGKVLSDAERNSMHEKFRDIKFDGITKFYPLPENLVLPYKHNNITFDFAAIEPARPYLVRYQYILEGYDNDWDPITNATTVTFGNIYEGTYTFKLKAQSPFGVWSEPITYTFKVLPPWYRHWLAYLSYVLILMSCIFLIVWWNGRRLRAKAVELTEEVRKATLTIVEKNKIVEEKHKEITDSINYAERIQRSFLASTELLNENLNEHFVFFQPKDVVSGDFYWASRLGNGTFALATADSTGHGVPGAIMSILNISSLEKAVENDIFEPSEILSQTRKTIIGRLKKDGSPEGGKDGMDASLICFDFANQKFTYSAANNPIWVIRKNNLIELKPDKMPIGKSDKDQIPFTQNEFQLQKGDTIYTLTDGFPDQFWGGKGKKFMSKQLKELLLSISSSPMKEQKQKLNDVFDNWKGNLEQVDDVCLIGIRV